MRIPLVEPEQVSPQVKRIYDSRTQRFGRVSPMSLTAARAGRS